MTPTKEQIVELLTKDEDSEYYSELTYLDDGLAGAIVALAVKATDAGLFGKDRIVNFWPVDDENTAGGLVTVDVGNAYTGPRYASRYNEFRDLMDDTEVGFEMLTSVLVEIGRLVDGMVPKVQVLHERHPDYGCETTVFIGDFRVDAEVEDIDPGAGSSRADWDERTDEAAKDTSNFGQAVVMALNSAADSEHIYEEN